MDSRVPICKSASLENVLIALGESGILHNTNPRGGMMMGKRQEHVFDWGAFVPGIVNPIKVAIVEAMQYMGQPLSATELTRLFGDPAFNLPSVSYHVVTLAQGNALVKVRERQVRGAMEKFYFFQAR